MKGVTQSLRIGSDARAVSLRGLQLDAVSIHKQRVNGFKPWIGPELQAKAIREKVSRHHPELVCIGTNQLSRSKHLGFRVSFDIESIRLHPRRAA
jgi:hypothetical protein